MWKAHWQFRRHSCVENPPPFIGVEWSFGSLVPESFSDIFASVTFFYLPQRGFGAGLLAAQGARELVKHCAQQWSHLLLDWPNCWVENLSLILKTFPESLACAVPDLLKRGLQFIENPGENESLDEVFFLEALNPRRVFLRQLAHLSALPKVTALGGTDGHMASLVENQGHFLDHHLPTEMLLPFGLLPFLEGRLSLCEKSLAFEPTRQKRAIERAQTCAERIWALAQKKEPTLVVGDEELFLYLPLALHQVVLQKNTGREEVLSFFQAREGKRNFSMARTPPEDAAQHGALNGFQTRMLLAHLDSDTPETGHTLFEKSLLQSFQAAEKGYQDWSKRNLSLHEKQNLFRFLRRLTKEKNQHFPCQFDMLLAAQSVIDANFSFEWLKECRLFPKAEVSAHQAALALPELRLPLQAFTPHVSTLNMERFDTLARHKPRIKPRLVKKESPKLTSQISVSEEKYADNAWAFRDHPYSCSFPDEDVFMEDFSFALKEENKERLQALENTPRELTASLEDGLDIRETLRQWPFGKIMVKEESHKGRADVGAVVFHFAKPEEEDKYSWKAFWHAEHHDKSHLMFYATPYQEQLIGPGVARSEFGGFSVLPLTAFAFDPWQDPYLQHICRSPLECLLVASALGTQEKALLFLSNTPPPRHIYELVRRSGKTILYRKLEECAPDKIQRLRTFHILAEAGVRAYAQKYIRKEPLI
jgi:hypothetical protein